MARLFKIIVFLSLGASVVHASGQFEYVSVESIQKGPIVTVEEIDSFVHLAQSNDVQTILVPSEASSLSSRFMFAVDGVVYSTEASEYNTIKEYSDGNEAGFEYGKDFYHARELGIESFSQYARFLDGWFQSVEDMEDAYARGFGDASFEDLQLIFPPRVARGEFESTLLPILVRATIQNQLFSEQSNPYGVSLEELYQQGLHASGYRPSGEAQATVIPRIRSGRTPSLRQLSIETPSPPYYGSEIYAAVEEGTASVLREIEPTDSTMQDHDSMSRGPESTRRGYSAGGVGYALDDGEFKVHGAIVAEWDPKAAGVYFYLARLHGYDSFQAFRSEYADLRRAVERGFLSLADARASEEAGFRSASEYYTAQDRGFDNRRDYELAGRLEVDSSAYYDQYLPIITRLNQLRDGNGIPNSDSRSTPPLGYKDALVLYMFDRIPEGRIVSTSAVLSRTEGFIENNPALENLVGGLSRLQQSWLDNFIEQHGEVIEEFGELRTEDGVFVGG